MASYSKSNGTVNEAFEIKAAHIRPRWLPTVSYTTQNILISLGTLAGAFASLMFTISVILPLACLRALLSRSTVALIPPPESLRRGKVVLIIGASSGIGLEVLKQYCPEPDTTVIAVSAHAEHMRNAIIQLGDTPATLQMETIDLAGPPKQLADSIKQLDEKYGPISHMYAIAGVSNHKEDRPWNLESFEKMIKVNVSGTAAICMAMYERMKSRHYGKICIVGSIAGVYGPANMISYSSTKAFVNTFSSNLRVLAAAANVDVVTVEPGFIDTPMTKSMRGQGSSVPWFAFEHAEMLAVKMKRAVEKGGIGLVTWPVRHALFLNALKGLNPICEEIGRYASMKGHLAGKKIS